MNKGKVLEEDSPSSFHHNAAMSDRRRGGRTKSKIREEPGVAEICDWYTTVEGLCWWLWDRKLGACLKQLPAAGEQLQQLHMCPNPAAASLRQTEGTPPRARAAKQRLAQCKNLKPRNWAITKFRSAAGRECKLVANKVLEFYFHQHGPCLLLVKWNGSSKLLPADQIEHHFVALPRCDGRERGERGAVGCDV